MINTMQLKDKLSNIANNKQVEYNSVLRFYMYDRFIERLSQSKYCDNFILKGGFYLSTLFGIDNRSTMDIDTALQKINFTKDEILNILNEIIEINLNDEVVFKIKNIEDILEDSMYGGFRVTIQFQLKNIRDSFHLDIVTGDVIYPGPINYKYKSIFNDKIYNVWSYNLEAVIAEKIETIFSRLDANGRMKDYYDIYMIYTFRFKKVNKVNLKKAIVFTCENRHFETDFKSDLNIIESSIVLKNRWENYSKKHMYAKNIEYKDVMNALRNIVEIL